MNTLALAAILTAWVSVAGEAVLAVTRRRFRVRSYALRDVPPPRSHVRVLVDPSPCPDWDPAECGPACAIDCDPEGDL